MRAVQGPCSNTALSCAMPSVRHEQSVVGATCLPEGQLPGKGGVAMRRSEPPFQLWMLLSSCPGCMAHKFEAVHQRSPLN